MKLLQEKRGIQRDMESLRDYVDEGPVGKRRLPVIVADDEDEDEIEAEDGDEAENGSEGQNPEAKVAERSLLGRNLQCRHSFG